MRRLELEVLLADREAVRAMLTRTGSDDPVARLCLGARLSAIEAEIQRLAAAHETVGAVALVFSGTPVHGSHAIAADLAKCVLKPFQELVLRRIASDELGRPGGRGRMAERRPCTLAIHELLRGPLGFVLEEARATPELADTPVKKAIDDVAETIGQIAAEPEQEFEACLETLELQMLAALREFFQALDDGGTSVHIVEDKKETWLDVRAVHRARVRVEAADVQESELDDLVGELLGLLPDSRRFEMKVLASGEVIRGAVAPALASRCLEIIRDPEERLAGEVWRATMRVREIRERDRPARCCFTLLGLAGRA